MSHVYDFSDLSPYCRRKNCDDVEHVIVSIFASRFFKFSDITLGLLNRDQKNRLSNVVHEILHCALCTVKINRNLLKVYILLEMVNCILVLS